MNGGTVELRNYVGGRWVASSAPRFTSTNPMDGSAVATAPVSDAADVDAAVGAARAAVDARIWSDLRGADRAIALGALADALQAREREAGELIAREMGKPIRIARGREVGGAIDRLRFYAGAARTLDGRFVGAPPPALWDMEIPEPIGIAALIIPWNDPIDLLIRKLGAALAAGCAVVIKPSELTPASTGLVVELADQITAFPPGVINLIHGPGSPTGEALVDHPDVDKVAFTGSTGTGKRIMARAAERLARVSMECGGKAPAIVFGDADLPRALDALTYGAFMYSGQSCTACTRLVVEDAVYDEVVEGMIERSRAMPTGDPMDTAMLVGPMASQAQYDKAKRFIEIARADGAKVLLDGEAESRGGLFLAPTILAEVPLTSSVVQQEVFGPVLVVHRVADEREALSVANATRFGLGASVWTGDGSRALRVARALDFADVWVNGYYLRHAETTFGGRHESGIGRELGIHGIEEYVSWKRVCIDTRTEPFHLKTWFEEGQDFKG
jgi:acyl-CoA reductase-like NAD-dependent aldehyde dehydrogenase